MRKKDRPKLVFKDFTLIDGVKVEIEPLKTNLPDRCKLALMEMTTGLTYEIVKSGS